MHERFRFKSSEELLEKAEKLGLLLPFSEDTGILLSPVMAGSREIANRFVVQPMEGYDSEPGGSPSELTIRRYLRYAGGGSGIIWSEAIAVMHEGRSNPRQLMLNRKNIDDYRRLIELIREKNPLKTQPLIVAQLTHSGRYSKPDGTPRPLVPCRNPLLDRGNETILTDNQLAEIMDRFIETAITAYEAGFDAVDIKACHGYLIHELLFSYHRQNSVYGGPEHERRFRFLLETIDRIMQEKPGMPITTRINLSDLYPGGFGTTPDGRNPELSEALMLARELEKRGITILNTTMGSPYFNPHVVRPFDNPLPGSAPPDEHPLAGVIRMINGAGVIQKNFPGLKVAGSAYSWLRQYSLNVGAGAVKEGLVTFIGFGRNSFAYPEMPLDLLTKGKTDPGKFCITCSGCTRLIRSLRPGGCVIHDRKIYGAELKKLIADGK